jgi:hypothetical protein
MVKKYELSEKIAYQFSLQGIPAVSAIENSGRRLFIIENTGYLVELSYSQMLCLKEIFTRRRLLHSLI